MTWRKEMARRYAREYASAANKDKGPDARGAGGVHRLVAGQRQALS